MRNNITDRVFTEDEEDDYPIPHRSIYFVSEFGTMKRRSGDVGSPLSNRGDSAFQTILSRHELKNQKHIVQVVVSKNIEDSVKMINAKIPTMKDHKKYSNRNCYNINKWAY